MRLPYYTHAAQIFHEVASRAPGKAALLLSDTPISYERLDRLSNQVAHLLLERGLRKRDTLCICLEKGLLPYAVLLACLKIGVAYFFVDPENPEARTRSMLERCTPALAFVKGAAALSFGGTVIAVDERDAELAFLAGLAETPVERPWEIAGSDPAYVMFTSGSTGAPKGVTISQSNLVNFILWTQNQFAIEAADVFTGVNPLFFDNSVFDTYSSLFTGATLVPFDAATMRDPKAVLDRIDAARCTIYFSVPSLLIYFQRLKLITPTSFSSLRKMIFGGEGYPKPMLLKLFQALADRIELHNVYGPTECTCICSSYRISQADFEDLNGYPPLGQLIANFSHVIIAESGAEVARGEVGELCLGGPCVGLGYYGAPELTAQAFVQNPTHTKFFDRVYKTGDLVRHDSGDGKIHFVGRRGTQIKHQGYRIELGEIEHALASVEGVDEAAAVYSSIDGTGRILAVVASKSELRSAAIRSAIAARLPKYMIPERVYVVRQLLKNANGKVDRNAIAAAIAQGVL